ncbi:hypothetical protein ACVXHB_10975 [Escherichia coli]
MLVGTRPVLAAASSTAARLAGPGKAGRAVAVVFGGFTLAMAIGVPLKTWLGAVDGVQFRRYCRFWRVRIPWTVVLV